MRALLVVNPAATTAGTRHVEYFADVLRTACDVTVQTTQRRGHATELAESAAGDGYGLVVAHGGDGTVNEIANGLMRTDAAERPRLAVIPGGHGNVFSRALGQPTDPAVVAVRLARAVSAGRIRVIGLG